MTKFLTTAACALAIMAAPAFANQTEDQCNTYAAENDGDASGCACLAASAENDATLAAALAEISTPADLEAVDEATGTAIAACYPEA